MLKLQKLAEIESERERQRKGGGGGVERETETEKERSSWRAETRISAKLCLARTVEESSVIWRGASDTSSTL